MRWANEARRQLPRHLLGRQFLKVARVEAGSIVDQHVDPAEPVDGGSHRRLGIGTARDVQFDGQQVVRLSQSRGHAVAVPARGRNRMACRQRGLGEIDPHATAGSGDEPDLLVTHGISFFRGGWTSPSTAMVPSRCRQRQSQVAPLMARRFGWQDLPYAITASRTGAARRWRSPSCGNRP